MRNNKKCGGKKWKINGKIGNLFSKIPDKKWRENRGKYKKMWKKNKQKCSKNDCFSIKTQVEMLKLMFYLQKSKIERVSLISDSF